MRQILVIHGGNAFEKYDDYVSYLKNREINLEKINFKDWKRNLSNVLGDKYQVIIPGMPNSQNARYSEWKIWFDRIIPLLDEKVALIGHSLGGIFLAKYLSENRFPKEIVATFLVAAPFNAKDEHPLVDFILSEDLSNFEKQGGKIFLYHSKDDQIVPFSNLLSFNKALPNAEVRVFNNRNHFNDGEFPEIVSDLRSLDKDDQYSIKERINVYIDGNNLYRSAKRLKFKIDYKKFRGWIGQKFSPNKVYLFIGLVPGREKFYEYLQESGFILIFKQTITVEGKIKGNCDAELVLKVISDFYSKLFDECYIITNDGDFECLVEFLIKNQAIKGVIAPDKEKCSILLRNKNIKMVFLNEHYRKFSNIIKEKAPDADASA